MDDKFCIVCNIELSDEEYNLHCVMCDECAKTKFFADNEWWTEENG